MVVVHGQDDERDEVVVAFCVNTGRLLGTFEGSRESLLGGGGSLPLLRQVFKSLLISIGGLVSQTQSGHMEVRKVVEDGLLHLGTIQDLRRRFCVSCRLTISFCDFQGSLLSSSLLAIARCLWNDRWRRGTETQTNADYYLSDDSMF